jgi:hypothetical protein
MQQPGTVARVLVAPLGCMEAIAGRGRMRCRLRAPVRLSAGGAGWPGQLGPGGHGAFAAAVAVGAVGQDLLDAYTAIARPRDHSRWARRRTALGRQVRLNEFDRDTDAWQLEVLRRRAARLKRLGGTLLERLADLDAEVIPKTAASPDHDPLAA